MFTGFGSIFTPAGPRRTENTDTRMGLRKHEVDPEERREKREKRDFTEFDMNDDMAISVKALQIFLENILKAEEDKKHVHNAFDKALQDGKADKPKDNKKKPAVENKHSQNAQAAGAYASRANYNQESYNAPKPSDDNAAYEELISATDIRQIVSMIDDLKSLASQGCDEIHLEKSATFLSALEAGISKAKSSYGV